MTAVILSAVVLAAYWLTLLLLRLDSRHTGEIHRHNMNVIDNGLLIQALKKEMK